MLEQILAADDVSADARVRALDRLRDLDAEREREELRAVADEALRQEIDDLTAANLTTLFDEGGSGVFPRSWALVEAEVGRRVRERLAAIEDVRTFEAEVDRRAREIAEARYRRLEFDTSARAPEPSEGDEEGGEDDEAVPAPDDRRPAEEGYHEPPGWELSRGWPEDKPGLFRR